MEEIASACALLVAGVLAWAGVAKWRRPSTTAAAFAALGVPGPRLAARVVPLVESAVAVSLVVRPSIGGWAAFTLLAVFTAMLVPSISGGKDVQCACFGSSSAAPVSAVTLVRNAMLLAAAFMATAAARLDVGWAGVIAVGTVAVAGAVVLALCELYRATGHLFPRVGA